MVHEEELQPLVCCLAKVDTGVIHNEEVAVLEAVSTVVAKCRKSSLVLDSAQISKKKGLVVLARSSSRVSKNESPSLPPSVR